MKTIVLNIILLIVLNTSIFSQACCSAGTPLLGTLDMSSTIAKNLQINLTYNHNVLESVYSGTLKLEDNTRSRLTRTALFELSYGFNNYLSLTTLFTYVNQHRSITSYQNQTNDISTNGLGDAVVMLKYNILNQSISKQTILSLGGGLKLPTGKSDLTNNGILLPADMQPGSGSLDFLFWGFYSRGFMPDIPLTFVSNISYKINTTNDRFTNSELGYKFGNEFILSAGLGYRTDTIFDFSLFFRLRNTSPDQFDKQQVPNTGGIWLYAIPGINVKMSNKFTTRLTSEIPIYRNLEGTQLTTSYAVSVSIIYSYSFNNFL